MKAILKENGNETILKEGTLEELKGYLKNELENLLEWANEEENNWNDFEELKKEIKENVENAEDTEELEQAFEEINTELSWWGIFFKDGTEMKKEVEKIINELKNGEREFIDLSDDSLFIDNELELKEKLDIDEFDEFFDKMYSEYKSNGKFEENDLKYSTYVCNTVTNYILESILENTVRSHTVC